MKKYIVPTIKAINLESESLMAMSNYDVVGNNLDLSNKRNHKTTSDVIWGFDDEADAEY